MKKLLIIAVLAGSAANAHAGFFDFIFGKEESSSKPEAVEVTQPEKTKISAPVEQAKASTSVVDMAMGLLPTLTQSLGVTDSQAEGGMGALLQAAQSNLSKDEFGTLSQGIPGIETMLSAAPLLGGGSTAKGLGGALSALGGPSGSLGVLGQITQQFEALGLSPDMVLKFAQLAIEYFSNDGSVTEGGVSGTDIGALLQKSLGIILK